MWFTWEQWNWTENYDYVLNEFFSNIVTNLKLGQYSNYDPQVDNSEDPSLRAVLKYKDHPSVLASEEQMQEQQL